MLSPFHFEYFLFVVFFVAMFIYSLFELEISVDFDVIFNEKLEIGESVDFS